MSEIPEDIIDAAKQAERVLMRAPFPDGGWQAIARAILAERQAERERCNAIVREAFGKNVNIDALNALAKCDAIVASHS